MSYATTGHIRVTGTIATIDTANALIDAALDDGAGIDYRPTPATATELFLLLRAAIVEGTSWPLNTVDSTSGAFMHLEETCRRLGVAYSRCSGANSDGERHAAAWRPGLPEPIIHVTDAEETPLIPVPKLKKLLDLPHADILAELRRLIVNNNPESHPDHPTSISTSPNIANALTHGQDRT